MNATFPAGVSRAILSGIQSFAPNASLNAERDTEVIRVTSQCPAISLRIDVLSDDIIIGFDRAQWHTHPDLFGASTVDEMIEVTIRYARAILEDRETIVASSKGDIWVTDDPVREKAYCPPDEQLVIGRWSEIQLPKEWHIGNHAV